MAMRYSRPTRKTYQPLGGQARGNYRMAGGLAPIPSVSRTQPTTPMPGPLPVGIAGGRSFAQQHRGAPQLTGPSGLPMTEVLNPLHQTHPLIGAGHFSFTGPMRQPERVPIQEALQRFTPGQFRNVGRYGLADQFAQAQQAARTPMSYEDYAPGQGTDVAAQVYRQALQLSPEAYKVLDADTAAWLQTSSEQRAHQEAQQRAQQALGVLSGDGGAGGAAAGGAQYPGGVPAPNLQELTGQPGMAPEYWSSMATKQEGEIRRQNEMQANLLREQSQRSGGGGLYYGRKLAELAAQTQQQIAQMRTGLDLQRAQQAEQARQKQAGLYLQRYGMQGQFGMQQQAQDLQRQAQDLQRQQALAKLLTEQWPQGGEGWTNVEAYLRGAGYEEQMANQARRASTGGGAGGGGGATGFPAYQTWTEASGVVET